MEISDALLEQVLRTFLAEDVGYGDITTNALVAPAQAAEGIVISKDNAVIAGIEETLTLLDLVGCKGKSLVSDGRRVRAGTKIVSATGPARDLLAVERTLLNLLSRMSGVATATADLVEIARKESKGRVRVACTRKTLPGLRYFEKKAVEIGGGDTHRLRLDDAVLIKDNHLAIVGSIDECVRTARSKVSFTKKIEVEATTPDQAVEAARAGADIVLLDNMSSTDVKRSLDLLKEKNLRDHVLAEASGSITRENIASYARTGVDIVSAGAITHSARAVDVSMEIRPAKKRAC